MTTQYAVKRKSDGAYRTKAPGGDWSPDKAQRCLTTLEDGYGRMAYWAGQGTATILVKVTKRPRAKVVETRRYKGKVEYMPQTPISGAYYYVGGMTDKTWLGKLDGKNVELIVRVLA